jgi:hypothetical protein
MYYILFFLLFITIINTLATFIKPHVCESLQTRIFD